MESKHDQRSGTDEARNDLTLSEDCFAVFNAPHGDGSKFAVGYC